MRGFPLIFSDFYSHMLLRDSHDCPSALCRLRFRSRTKIRVGLNCVRFVLESLNRLNGFDSIYGETPMALNRICVFYGQRCDRPSLRCCNSQNGRFFNTNRCQFIPNNPAQKDYFCHFCGKRFTGISAERTPNPSWPWPTHCVRKVRASAMPRSKHSFEIALGKQVFLKFSCKKPLSSRLSE